MVKATSTRTLVLEAVIAALSPYRRRAGIGDDRVGM
jgi:hypothetical protein